MGSTPTEVKKKSVYLNLCFQERRLSRDIRLAVEEYWKPRLQAEDAAKMSEAEVSIPLENTFQKAFPSMSFKCPFDFNFHMLRIP